MQQLFLTPQATSRSFFFAPRLPSSSAPSSRLSRATGRRPAALPEQLSDAEVTEILTNAAQAGETAAHTPERRVRRSGFGLQVKPSGSDTSGLVIKILDLLKSQRFPNATLVLTSRATLTLAMRAVLDATAVLKQQDSSASLCCFLTVNRGTLTELLEAGISQSSSLILKISKVQMQQLTEVPTVRRVAKGTDWRRLSDTIAADLMVGPGATSLEMMGDLAAEVAFKALLKARSITIPCEFDVQVIPHFSTKTTEEGEFQVMTLSVRKGALQRKEAASSGAGSRSSSSSTGKDRSSSSSSSSSSTAHTDVQHGAPASYEGSTGTVTISAEKWRQMNEQIEELSRNYAQLAGLLASNLKQQQSQ